MKRAVLFALMLSVGNASAALAGETLLQAAVRAADQAAAADASGATKARRARPDEQRRTPAPRAAVNYQQSPGGLQEPRLGTKTKMFLGLGVAAILAGAMVAIDGRVEDNTPSTRGERTTKPF